MNVKELKEQLKNSKDTDEVIIESLLPEGKFSPVNMVTKIYWDDKEVFNVDDTAKDFINAVLLR
jgi:hypothetical protein